MRTRAQAMADAKNFNLNIQNFSGENESVAWFLDQICQMKELFTWSNEVALCFLKGKLTGVARDYVANNPRFKNAGFENTCKHLREFFEAEENPTANLMHLNHISLLPGESIRNFGHRIESLVARTYTSVNDQKALNQIKSLQLINGLPPNMKEVLILEDSSDFNKLLDKAAKIANAKTTVQVLNHHAPVSNNSNADDLKRLESQIQNLTLKLNEIKCQFCNQPHTLAECQAFKATISKDKADSCNHITVDHSERRDVMCHFCNKKGHIMAHCRLYLASTRPHNDFYQNQHPRYVTPRFPHYNYPPPPRFNSNNQRYPQQRRQFRPNGHTPNYDQNQTFPKQTFQQNLNSRRGY